MSQFGLRRFQHIFSFCVYLLGLLLLYFAENGATSVWMTHPRIMLASELQHTVVIYVQWVKKFPCGFLTFFPKRMEIFNQFFTQLLYVPFYTKLYTFLFNYRQLWRSYAIGLLSVTTQRIFTFHYKFAYWANDINVDVMSYPLSDMFVDIIKVFILQWLATDNDQQNYQRLTQKSERARFVRWWTFCAYYLN